MRILVISDTHRHLGSVMDLLGGPHQFDRILHLGDLVKDAEDIQSFSGLPVDCVAGNCDWSSSGDPYSRILEIAGKRIYMTHGHMEHVKRSDHLIRKIMVEENCDIGLFGHTHMAMTGYEGDRILMNPGSISLPRDGAPSFGTIHIDGKGVIHTNIARIDH